MQHRQQSIKGIVLTVFISGTLLTGCAYQTYTAKPLNASGLSSEFRAHDPLSADFQTYLKSQGYEDGQTPVQDWSLNELIYSALYFHPDLDLARAIWRASQAAEKVAGQRPNPGISGDIEHHSETDNGISPWTFGLAIDIPIETAGKRQARIDRAANLSEAARIEIAQTAWKVRSRVYASWIAYQAALDQTRLLEEELALRSEIAAMLEARLHAGMVSSLESANARLQLQKTRQLLDTEKAHLVELKSRLANHAGLSLESLNKVNLLAEDKSLSEARREIVIADPGRLAELQESALLNRLDIRAALARYEGAEAKLRLEIARQYPDVVLSPGYIYDQGDKIWSLGLSTLLSLFNRNEGNIAEAEAQREVEAAKFRTLQAEIIGELESRKAAYIQALNTLNDAKHLLDAQTERTQLTQKQFEQGIADRLELTTTRLENLLARQTLINSDIRVRRASHALEETMQYPLENPLSMPGDFDREAPIE